MSSSLFNKINKGKWTKLKVLFLLVYLTFVIVFIFLTTGQTYGVNDDVLIQSILSGKYTGKPDFILSGPATPKILFGYLISTLYGLVPFVNWFSILMLSLVIISWFILGLIALKNFEIVNVLFYCVISFIYLIWYIPSPTYTASAIITSIAVFSKVIIDFDIGNLKVFLYSILLSLALLMRPESFMLGFLCVIPILFYSFIWRGRKNLKKYFIILSIIVTVSLINFGMEKKFIDENDNWAKYAIFESLRYKIQANDIEDGLLQDPSRYNWTFSEAVLFSEYLTVDVDKFNTLRYSQLISEYKNINYENGLIQFFVEGHKKLIDSDINWAWFELAKIIPLAFVLFLFLTWPNSYTYLFIYFSTSLLLYLAMLYIAYFLRQPERVQVSAIFAAILIPFLIYNVLYSNEKFKLDIPLIGIIFLVFFLILVSSLKQIDYFETKYNGMKNIWSTQKTFYESFPSDSIFIGNASQFRNNWSNPYISTFEKVENQFFSLGWHNFSPYWIERATTLKLDPYNLIQSSIDQKNVYWVMDDAIFKKFLNFIDMNMYEYSKFEKIKSIDLVGTSYAVWKIS